MAPRSLIGALAQVTITAIGSNTLFGALVQDCRMPALTAAGA
jgi:hypothetical protein